MQLHHIGMRTLKTAFAVFACLLIGRFFNPDGLIFAVIAAIVCMQRTAKDSRRSGVERIVGTTIGSMVGYLVLQLSQWIPYYKEWVYMAVIPLGTMASIYLSLRVNRQTAVPMSAIVFLCVVCDFTRGVGDALAYVLVRYLGTLVGIVAATLINWLIAPYDAPPEEGECPASPPPPVQP